MARTVTKRSDRLLKVLAEQERILVLSHDNPDPDAIDSGWAVVTLVREKTDRPVRFVAGGPILRAENQRMLELLKPPIELLDQVEPEPGSGVVLVDVSPTAANYQRNAGNPVAVIDHHQQDERRLRLPYRDIRPKVAATGTIVTHYLREQCIEPSADLATALTYAIRSDALGWPVFSRTDRRALTWLAGRTDHNKLADIENAPLAPEYYEDLLLAIESAFVYDDVGLCFLPHARGSDIIAEVSDLLIRHRGLSRVMCAGVVNGDLLVSVRAKVGAGDAARLVAESLKGLGHGGGHRHRAGGRAAAIAKSDHVSEDLQSELRNRWLAACGVDAQRGTRLVPVHQILGNL